MSKELLTDVRNELASRSTTASLSDLQKKGMDRVRVIRSSQVLQLIEEAVDRALVTRGLDPEDPEREQVLETSKQIFRDMMQTEVAPSPDQEMVSELCRRVEHAEAAMTQFQQELASKDQELQEARSQAAEFNAKLQLHEKRTQTAAPEALLDELRALRNDIRVTPHAGGGTAADAEAAAMINSKIADLGKELGREIEKIGRKVGINPVEEVATDLSALFAAPGEMNLENNLDTISPEERKGADVSEALARMKSLKGGKS